MTISPDWIPDPREVYEPEMCRLRNVYRTMAAEKDYYCDQCHCLIHDDVEYDAVAVEGAGVGGYTHPSRIHTTCRKDYINRQNERYAEQYGILLYICMKCGVYFGYTDGRGETGLSHGICGDECEKVWMAEVTQ